MDPLRYLSLNLHETGFHGSAFAVSLAGMFLDGDYLLARSLIGTTVELTGKPVMFDHRNEFSLQQDLNTFEGIWGEYGALI